jgi:hypothetical protein
MTLYRDISNLITLASGEIAYTQWSYVDGLDHGPQYVSASFKGEPGNNGTATTIQTSAIVFNVQTVAYNTYTSLIRNDGATPFIMNVNLGNFE